MHCMEGQPLCTFCEHNQYTPEQEEMVLRRAKDGSRQSVKCPTSVKLYNRYMGGVDVSDARKKVQLQ